MAQGVHASNIVPVTPWKTVNGFSVSVKNGSYVFNYKNNPILTRSGSLENWEKYSNKEGVNGVQCGNDEYFTLTAGTGSDLPILEKKTQSSCKDSLLSKIYFVSKKTTNKRYYILWVGKQYRDWNSAYFYETYIFDTVTKKVLQIQDFSEGSEGSGVTIQEGKSGIYINNLVIAKDLSKVLAEIEVFHDWMDKDYKKKLCEVSNKWAKSICINVSDVITEEEKQWGVSVNSIDLLLQKKIRIHLFLRATERDITKIVQL
jgi:hypothetical protein